MNSKELKAENTKLEKTLMKKVFEMISKPELLDIAKANIFNDFEYNVVINTRSAYWIQLKHKDYSKSDTLDSTVDIFFMQPGEHPALFKSFTPKDEEYKTLVERIKVLALMFENRELENKIQGLEL